MSIKSVFLLLKTFFVRRSPEEADNEYNRLLEEQYQLHEYGGLNLFEQNNMTAEDRAWWLKRAQKEIEERNKRERGGGDSIVP